MTSDSSSKSKTVYCCSDDMPETQQACLNWFAKEEGIDPSSLSTRALDPDTYRCERYPSGCGYFHVEVSVDG